MTDDEIDAVMTGLSKLYSTLGANKSVSTEYLKETLLNAGTAISQLRRARNDWEVEVADVTDALEEGQTVWAEARRSRGGIVTGNDFRIVGYDPVKMQDSIDKALESKVVSGFSRLSWENGP